MSVGQSTTWCCNAPLTPALHLLPSALTSHQQQQLSPTLPNLSAPCPGFTGQIQGPDEDHKRPSFFHIPSSALMSLPNRLGLAVPESLEEPPCEPPALLLSCPVPSRVKTRHDASPHWEVNKIMLMKHLLHSMSCDHRRQWPPRRPFITVKVSCSPKPIPGPNGEGLALPGV